MTVKIITDSVADIPSQVAKELGITVIPLTVSFGSESYRDGLDLTTEEFYEKLAHSKFLPTTATTAPGVFTKAYDKSAEETDEILAIIVSSKVSATYDAAVQGKKLRKSKCRLEIIDPLRGIMGEGLVVIAAAKVAQAGASLDELVDITHNSIRRSGLRITFDTLEYLSRGGRIGAAQAFLASRLKINPILTITDSGAQPVSRKRSRTKVIDYLYNYAMSYTHIVVLCISLNI